MGLEVSKIENILVDKFGTSVESFKMEHDILTFEANPLQVKNVIQFMHHDTELRFNFLTDLCAIHYPENTINRQFVVVYLLHNWIDNIRVRVKAFLSADKLEIETITDIFSAANWMERETYDFYGIKFINHPNLKRILNDEGMEVFPMRKEYPLEDRGRSDKDDRFFGRTTNNYQPK